MSIKLVLLKSGEQLIADVGELFTSEISTSFYLLKNPQTIGITKSIVVSETPEVPEERSFDVTLSSWVLLAKEQEITISSDWVLSVVEPLDKLIEMYKEKLDGKDS